MFWKKERKKKKPKSPGKKLVEELGIMGSIRLGCGVVWLGALLVFVSLLVDSGEHPGVSNPDLLRNMLLTLSGGIVLLPILRRVFWWWVDRPRKR